MKCQSTSIRCFDIPLAQPLRMGDHRLASRQGAYLVVKDSSDHEGTGECAPLLGLSVESMDEALAQLRALATQLRAEGLSESGHPEALEKLFPSVRLALDMALMDLAWQRSNRFPEGDHASVALNGLIMGQGQSMTESVTALLDQGYGSIKIKVARQSLGQDIENVRRIRELAAGRARLRLDANRTWSLAQACEFARAIGPESIEYIEEPTARPQDHHAFWQETGLPVALDESLHNGIVPEGLVHEGTGAFVLKPAAIGSLGRVEHLVEQARHLGIPAVLSSVFESPVALRFYARLAFVHGLQDTAHGLDTWRCFGPGTEGLPRSISKGRLIL